MLAIIKKELKTYFFSPIGYIFIGIFVVMASLFFYIDIVANLSSHFEYMFYSLTSLLTFIIPILTMRSFAEERKMGTDQLLFTSPQSILKIVLAKFLSLTMVLLIGELITLVYLGILCYLGTPHMPTVILVLIGYLLFGMAYISFGMLASSLTENQITAGAITIGFLIFNAFFSNISYSLECLSLSGMFQATLGVGIISIKTIVLFVSFILMCLILTMIVLQRRKNIK